jgi:hypothetical protein
MSRRRGDRFVDTPATARDDTGRARASRWLRRLCIGVVAVAFLLLMAVALTQRPGDPTLYPPPAGAPAVEVFVVSHGYHAGIVVPRAPAAEVAAALRRPSHHSPAFFTFTLSRMSFHSPSDRMKARS